MKKTRQRRKLWSVDVESKLDPYGSGIGYGLLVYSSSCKLARKLAERHVIKQKKYLGFMVTRVKPAHTNAVIGIKR